MSKESQRIFKLQLQLKKQQTNRKIKIRKSSQWLFPSAYIRQYRTFLKTFMKKYTDLTLNLFPLLSDWQKEVKQINDTEDTFRYTHNPHYADQWEEEIDAISTEQYETLFTEEKESLKAKLLALGVLVFAFNRKQWEKIITQSLGIEHFNYETWENSFLNAWVNRNVNLIKGLTEEYRKKVFDTIIDNYQRGVKLEELKDNLRQINKTFSEYRVNLIARDQISKINGQLSQQRQKDAGIDTYWWETSKDERVRQTHRVMQGKLCRWDDLTVYSGDMGKTWKSRSSIGGVLKHPQEDYQCRCTAIPNFEPLVNEINSTQESIMG